MDPDNYQQAWQAHSSQTHVAIDSDLLLKVVQRNQRDFRAMISQRDFREVGVAVLLLPVWFYMGITFSSPWTWYLTVPALIWVGGFILGDRMRQKRKPSEPGGPLLKSVKESLTQVEHQIWLLRNVFWWYLLPLGLPILASILHVSWIKADGWLDALSDVNVFVCLFLFALGYFLYYLNQLAVRLDLEPRRQELLTLLTSLRDETTIEDGQVGGA